MPATRKPRPTDSEAQTGPPDTRRFQRALLAWYDTNKRDLPWRRTRDPYAIWLSEIMLQQTRVAAVLEHYRIFLGRFPSIEHLAAAAEDDVLAAWSGLGYYRRARMMHQCARELAAHRNSQFPQAAAALQELPGIGRYTAAAIASIAFGEPVAVVDGNVERVLRRVHAVNLTSATTWQHAQTLLPNSRPGDFNQAMMELGATVCLPRDPQCHVCPVQALCATGIREISKKGSGLAQLEPPRAIPQIKREIWCALDRRNGQIRLVKRPQHSSLMPGMWEIPQLPKAPNGSAAAAKWRTFRHSITVTNYTVHVLRNPKTKLRSQSAPNSSAKLGVPKAQAKWIPIKSIPQLPITGLARKILQAEGII